MVVDQIKNERLELERAFNSNISPHAKKIHGILTEFEEFAGIYKSLWHDISLKISADSQNAGTTQLVDDRIAELWLALRAIANQYEDPTSQLMVGAGMKFLDDLRESNPNLFPTKQPSPDVLIFIKEQDNEASSNIARKYPYTDTFFIGINAPSNSTNPEEIDWIPIAHELGHYIYWNSHFKIKGSPNFAELDRDPVFSEDIRQALQTAQKLSSLTGTEINVLIHLMIAWSEEMFADVVGTSLLGKEYAISSKSLFVHQQENRIGARFTEDIDHPIPYLRPFVCAEAWKLVGPDKSDTLWSRFKAEIENQLVKNNFESQSLSVGLFSNEDTESSNFEEVSLGIPTIKDAIRIVVPVLFNLLQSKETRMGQQVGIALIRARMQDVFVDSYIDITDVLEKGDGPGFLRRSRRGIRQLLRIIFRRRHQD
jgi:hypothetical protein